MRSDLLPFTSRRPESFGEFLGDASNAAILFLGVLGQIDLHQGEFKRSKANATRRLLTELQGRSWASIHDLESTALQLPLKEIPPSILNLDLSDCKITAARIESLAEKFQNLGISTEPWVDHETEWLGKPAATVPWLLSPRKFHNLGWVAN